MIPSRHGLVKYQVIPNLGIPNSCNIVQIQDDHRWGKIPAANVIPELNSATITLVRLHMIYKFSQPFLNMFPQTHS